MCLVRIHAEKKEITKKATYMTTFSISRVSCSTSLKMNFIYFSYFLRSLRVNVTVMAVVKRPFHKSNDKP